MKQIISLRLEKQGAERRLTVSLPLFFPLSFSHTHFSASSLPIYGGKKNFQYKFKGYRTNKNNKIKYEGVWVEAIQESGYFYPTPIFKNTISNYLCSFHFSNGQHVFGSLRNTVKNMKILKSMYTFSMSLFFCYVVKI